MDVKDSGQTNQIVISKIPLELLSSPKLSHKKVTQMVNSRIQRYVRPPRIGSIDSTLELQEWPRIRTPTEESSQHDVEISSHHEMATNDLSSHNIVNGRPGPRTRVAALSRPGINTEEEKGLSSMAMGRSNKVADATIMNGLTGAITDQPEDPKSFMEKIGLGAMIGKGPEVHEYSKGRLNYVFKNLVLDANEGYYYYWVAVVSVAYVYNLIVVIARSVFVDLDSRKMLPFWVALDVTTDFIYLMDMFLRTHTGFLEQGLLVRDVKRIRSLYFNSLQFKIDIFSCLPIDYITLFLVKRSTVFRFNRLLKRERLVKFMEHTETRSSFPNAFRVGAVVWYIAVIIHWNACFYFLISETIGLGTDNWVYGVQNKQSLPDGIEDSLARRYIYSFYWSTLILTTIGEVPGPVQNVEFAFVTLDLMCGVLIFATIVGNVGSMISNMSAARTNFQNRMDAIKQYMELRRVGKQLEIRVIKWFDYLWANKQSLSDQQVLEVLPSKLQTEIAMHVHFETLRKVRIFQDCEAGLLAELVLKLQLQVFSPGDFVCRKGDIGREMYIVKRGMLQVVADDGSKVFATLSEGAVFGELSILNIQGSKNGNRRTANVRSLGYTDLFVLNKTDLWNALREYPEARKILINKGRELLRKDNLLDETAPVESKTAEEVADELQSSVRILQTRLARLMAEHTNTETKLKERVKYLEGKLTKPQGEDSDDEVITIHTPYSFGDNNTVTESAVELERQKLLRSEDTDSDSEY